jgi:hypothetical protein
MRTNDPRCSKILTMAINDPEKFYPIWGISHMLT